MNKNYSFSRFCWLNFALPLLALFVSVSGWAQVSAYSFAASSGTYTPITGGTVLNAPTRTFDDNVWAALPIGFSFDYAGSSFTQFGVNANGWIMLGGGAVTSSSTAISTGTSNFVIAAMNRDLASGYGFLGTRTTGSPDITAVANVTGASPGQMLSTTVGGWTAGTHAISSISGAGPFTVTMPVNATSSLATTVYAFNFNGTATQNPSEIRYETVGTAPNRELVVQFTQVKRFGTVATTMNGDVFSFQIRLRETSNQVQIVYGTVATAATGTLNTFQVGLRGASSADFNNVSTTTDWSAPTWPNGSNAASMTLTPTIGPASGQTYTWTPPACNAPSALLSTPVSLTETNITWNDAVSETNGYNWELRTAGACGSGSPLASGTTSANATTVNLPGLTAGTPYTFCIQSDCGVDGVSSWTSLAFQINPGDNCVLIQDLSLLVSPLASTTVGYVNDFNQAQSSCASGTHTAPDRIFFYTLPAYTGITVNVTTASFDHVNSLRVGGACPGATQVACSDPINVNQTYLNNTGTPETVYVIVDGWSSASGTFTLTWTIIPPCAGAPNDPTMPASPVSVCGNSTAVLTATGVSTGGGISYQWEESDDNGGTDPWAPAVGGTGANTASYTTPPMSSSRFYRLVTTCLASAQSTTSSATVQVTADFGPTCFPAFEVTKTDGVAFTSIASTGNNYTGSWTSATSTDDNMTASQTMPFAFTYFGTAVTNFRVSTNGWMSLSSASSASSFTNDLDVNTATRTAVLAPFWDDLVTTGNPGNGTTGLNQSMKWQLDGTAPNRVLTLEWIGMERFLFASPNLNFQVKLYETSNNIEFVYGNMTQFDGTANPTSQWSYSCGLNSFSTTTVPLNQRLILQSAKTDVFGSGPQDALDIRPDCYTSILFEAGGTPGAGTPLANITNDEPGTAILLGAAGISPTFEMCDLYRSAGATQSAGITVCGAASPGVADDDVWFTFTNPTAQDIAVAVNPMANYDAVVQVFSDAGTTSLNCANAGGNGIRETVNLPVLPPGTYYVRVYSAATGIGTLNSGWFHIQAYNPPPVPVNDECAFPTVLTPGSTCSYTAGTTLGATPSADAAPSCGNADDDVWYSFTTNNPDVEINVDGVLGFNAGFQVYSGSCGALVPVGSCVNATGSGGLETITLTGLTVPATYRIRVFHTASGTGNGAFDICVRNTCAPLTGITATGNFSPASLSASWTGVNADLYYGVAPLTAPNDLTTPTASNQASPYADNALTISQNYTLYVRSNCGGGIVGPWQGPFSFNTFPFVPLAGNAALTTCSATVYDHAGPSASYANNANGTLELTPANAGDVYQITGTFAVEGCCDNLIIYEGAGTGGPVLFDNGTNSTGSINIASTVPGGTVTIQFTSDVSNVNTGFALNVSCIAPPACGSITGLTATPTGVTAALNWDDTPSAINYEWQIVPQGNAVGVGVVTSGSSLTSDASVNSGLNPVTAYTAWVRSECIGGFGLWFNANFTTGIANDVCSGAIVVGCGASVSGSTSSLNGATNDLMPTQCGAASPDATQTANGVWYRYVGNDQTVTASLCTGTTYDSRISVYTGTCGTLTCVGGNDDACVLQSELTFNAFAGNDYYILVHGFGGSTGAFTLTISCATLCFTPNDDCATAQPITINNNGTGNPYTQYNECSTVGAFPNATCGGSFAQHTDEWFSFNNGLRDSLHFEILPVGPTPISGDYFAALYIGTCGTPTLIGCVGPIDVDVDGTFWLTNTPANTDYILRIYQSDNFTSTGGYYTITVSGEALCTGTPAPGATTTTASVVCPGQPFNISVSNNLPGGVSYVYQSGPSAAGPWTTVFTGIQTQIIIPTQSVNTWYRVRANCLPSGQTGIATPVQVSMSPVCYPVPSSPSDDADTEIFSTTVGTGTQVSDCITPATGAGSVLGQYSSYLNQPSLTNLVRGGSAGFDIAVNSCGGFFGSKVAIYIDFDQSGTFEVGEEVYEDALSSAGPNNRIGSFNIPVSVPLGQTGMRVILAEVGTLTDITPSLAFTWGEVEDYVVTIVNPAAANDFIGLAQPITTGAFPTCSAVATANLPVASDSPESNGVGNDVWYSFVATTNAARIAVIGGAAPHDTQIELRDGAGVIATENDNTANGSETMIVDNLIPNTTYFVGVTQLAGSATATVCVSHLRRSTCDNPTTFNSPCTNYKSQFTAANTYTVYFDDDGTAPFVATGTSTNGITIIPLSSFVGLPPMTSTTVYQVRVDATYNLPDAAGNITTAVVPGTFNCTRTVNAHAGVFLRDSDASPNVKPANAQIAANAWLCGALNYDWTIEKYTAVNGVSDGLPVTVSGPATSRFLNLFPLGLEANGIYKVNVRPIFAGGPGNLGPDRWLIIAGPAPMILDENQAAAFEKNGAEATIESALYPNPSNGSFVNLNITGVEANVMVRVLDGMGRVVWTNNLVVEGSLNTIIAFERPLASGLYTVEMTYDGQVITERLMVQK
jgi:hypothetical protein